MSFLYLGISDRVLSDTEYSALILLWLLVFVCGGVFLPFEQETSRRLASRRVEGIGGQPVIRKMVLMGCLAGALVILLTAAFASMLADRFFLGQPLLVAGLMLGAAGYLVANLSQGVLAGNGRFPRYGAFLGIEAVIRLTICIVLLASGVTTAGPIGLALGVAPLLTGLILMGTVRGVSLPGPDVAWGDIARGLGALMVGSVLAQLLINATPLLVAIYAGPDDVAEAGVFAAALVIARIPLFLFQAIQAALLPGLSRLAASGQLDAFRSGVTRLVALVAGLVALGCIAGFTVGPTIVQLFRGSEFVPSRTIVGLLAVGSGGYIISMALALAVVALGGARWTIAGWSAGVVAVAAVSAAAGGSASERVALGYAVGLMIAAGVMGLVLWWRLRSGAELEAGPLLDAVNEIVLEA